MGSMVMPAPPATGWAAGIRFLPQRPPQGQEFSPIAFGVAVVEEQVVTHVWRRDGLRVLDRAPVLFGAGCHFTDVRDHSVRVTAERAVDLFDRV